MNKDNIDLKNIWQQQKVSQPRSEELLSKVKQFKNASLRKLVFFNISLFATSAFIIFIWYKYQPQFITTKIGIVVIILAMLVYLLSYNTLFAIFNNIDNTQSTSAYLDSLHALKTKQKKLQTTMLSLYFAMLSLGLALYMYEYTSRMTISGAVLAYAITSAWIVLNWFYFRPKTIKKQQARLDELISKVNAVNEHLHAE